MFSLNRCLYRLKKISIAKMQLVLLFCLCVVTYCQKLIESNISKIITLPNQNATNQKTSLKIALNHSLKNLYKSENITQKQLMNINMDCQIFILEQLDFESLINMATINKQFQYLVNSVFRRKYGQQLFEITHVLWYSCPEKLIILDNEILIDHEVLPRLLPVFGHLIKKLRIKYNLIPTDQHTRVGMLVNKYCSETLLEFRLAACENGDFSSMVKPFKKVERLFISGILKNCGANSLSIDDLFPMMSYLSLYGISDVYHIINRHYIHLTELSINFLSSTLTDDDMKILFNNNRQIRSLSVQHNSIDFLKIANEHLPHLEDFIFDVSKPSHRENFYQGPVIYFENVKKVSIRGAEVNESPSIFKFKQLFNLELEFHKRFEKEWIEFIVSNNDLNILIVKEGFFNDTEVLALSTKLPNLTEAVINFEVNVTQKTILQFLENKIKMESFVFRISKFYRINPEKIFNQLCASLLPLYWREFRRYTDAHFEVLHFKRQVMRRNLDGILCARLQWKCF